jgi:hypothetical protein
VSHFCPPGSGSTDPIESGSNPDPDTDPDPQPCLHVAHNVGLLGRAEGAVAAAVGGALAREAASHLQVPVARVGQERGKQVCSSNEARRSVRAGREQSQRETRQRQKKLQLYFSGIVKFKGRIIADRRQTHDEILFELYYVTTVRSTYHKSIQNAK